MQDIVVTTALPTGYYRILDYFTPNLARPRPDIVYNGTDDILDAAATEEDGVTYIKFRKPLLSNDSAADYCLFPVRTCHSAYSFSVDVMIPNGWINADVGHIIGCMLCQD